MELAVRAATTGELGTRFVRADGSTAAEFPAGESDTDCATAEVEILRGDLAQLFLDATHDNTEYVFGDTIPALDQTDAGVRVSFTHNESREFDLVVVAEGKNAATRALVFGSEPEIRSLGMEMTYLTIPRASTDTDWWRWYSAPDGRGVTLRPDRHGTTRAVLTRLTGKHDGAPNEPRSADAQRATLRERFGCEGSTRTGTGACRINLVAREPRKTRASAPISDEPIVSSSFGFQSRPATESPRPLPVAITRSTASGTTPSLTNSCCARRA